jgi:hypothetical protein
MFLLEDFDVTTPRDLFSGPPGSEEAYRKASQAAEEWRAAHNHFGAGMAASQAMIASWGRPDLMSAAANDALGDFHQAMSSSVRGSPCWIASGRELIHLLGDSLWAFGAQRVIVDSEIHQLREELAQALFATYADDPHADNYLLRGIVIKTDLKGAWAIDFPAYDLDGGSSTYGTVVTLDVISSFRLFVANSDWAGADQIIKKIANAFTSPNQRGWRAVVLANINPQNAVVYFEEAADRFAEDSCPTSEEILRSGRSWSSINQDLWASFYRARARVVEAIQNPTNIKKLLTSAAECLPVFRSEWHSQEVARFALLINSLAMALSDQLTVNLKQAHEGMHGFLADPAREITNNRLAAALDALSRVPVIGREIADAARPALGEVALRAALGPISTWMHRVFEGITDEGVLRKILLRLLQAGLPLYAQLRHGPIEYGKDLVALVQVDNEVVLRLYQTKCGDLDKRKWRESKDELE